MTETNLSPIARKNRRQVLGLLLGSSLLGPVEFRQKSAAAKTNSKTGAT